MKKIVIIAAGLVMMSACQNHQAASCALTAEPIVIRTTPKKTNSFLIN